MIISGSQRRCTEVAVNKKRELKCLCSGKKKTKQQHTKVQSCPNWDRISTIYLYLLCSVPPWRRCCQLALKFEVPDPLLLYESHLDFAAWQIPRCYRTGRSTNRDCTRYSLSKRMCTNYWFYTWQGSSVNQQGPVVRNCRLAQILICRSTG